MDVATDLNKDVTTAFPVLEAVGKLEPGVYVMLARAGEQKPLVRATIPMTTTAIRKRRNGSRFSG
jgi:hypothetical protein